MEWSGGLWQAQEVVEEYPLREDVDRCKWSALEQHRLQRRSKRKAGFSRLEKKKHRELELTHAVLAVTNILSVLCFAFFFTGGQPSLQHVPCKFFMQGRCTAGNSCPFSHEHPENTAVCKCERLFPDFPSLSPPYDLSSNSR